MTTMTSIKELKEKLALQKEVEHEVERMKAIFWRFMYLDKMPRLQVINDTQKSKWSGKTKENESQESLVEQSDGDLKMADGMFNDLLSPQQIISYRQLSWYARYQHLNDST